MQSESRLRRYVRTSQAADIHGKTVIAKNLARNAAIKSIELTERYDQLEKLLAQWDSGNTSHGRVPRGFN